MEQPKYQRVLLKLSGEALAGPAGRGIDFPFVRQVCQVVKDCVDRGVQVGLVVGGGNYWRGVKDGGGQMERSRADQMGMLATVMNSLALQDVLEQVGQPARVLTSIPMGPVGEILSRPAADRWMQLERYGMFILMVALWSGVFDGFLGTARRVLVDWMLQGANGMFQAVLSLLV